MIRRKQGSGRLTWKAWVRLLVAVVMVGQGSCSGHRFYSKIDGNGKIVNAPVVHWRSPNTFVYAPDPKKPFHFRRGNGEVIVPQNIYTDGGSVPKAAWRYVGTPWDYAPAYIIHDWLYEANRRRIAGGVSPDGHPIHYNRAEADLILAEALKSQMEDPAFLTKRSPWHVQAIYWGVRYGAETAWNERPRPVKEEEAGPRLNPLSLLPLPDTRTLSGVLESFFSPVGAKPEKPEPGDESSLSRYQREQSQQSQSR